MRAQRVTQRVVGSFPLGYGLLAGVRTAAAAGPHGPHGGGFPGPDGVLTTSDLQALSLIALTFLIWLVCQFVFGTRSRSRNMK
jgi:hypothetical protein